MPHVYILFVHLKQVLPCCLSRRFYIHDASDLCRYVENNMLSGTVPSGLLNKNLVLKWVCLVISIGFPWRIWHVKKGELLLTCSYPINFLPNTYNCIYVEALLLSLPMLLAFHPHIVWLLTHMYWRQCQNIDANTERTVATFTKVFEKWNEIVQIKESHNGTGLVLPLVSD